MMDLETIHHDQQLTRKQLSAALEERGYRISPATLATKATRGGGPPYSVFCGRALYQWGPALTWARTTAGTPHSSTSEHQIQTAA